MIETAPTAGGFVECQLTVPVEPFDVLSTFSVYDLTGCGTDVNRRHADARSAPLAVAKYIEDDFALDLPFDLATVAACSVVESGLLFYHSLNNLILI